MYVTSISSLSQRPSALCQKETIQQNPTKGKKHCKVSLQFCSTDLKSVTPTQRHLEFQDELLTLFTEKIFCSCCKILLRAILHQYSEM